jgi:hypothetical protein
MGTKILAKPHPRSENSRVHHFHLSRMRRNIETNSRCWWTDYMHDTETTWSGQSKKMREDMRRCKENWERSREASGTSES